MALVCGLEMVVAAEEVTTLLLVGAMSVMVLVIMLLSLLMEGDEARSGICTGALITSSEGVRWWKSKRMGSRINILGIACWWKNAEA